MLFISSILICNLVALLTNINNLSIMGKFKIGDVVELISGGPQMTASSYDTDMYGTPINSVRCTWFDGLKVVEFIFHEDQLKKSILSSTKDI